MALSITGSTNLVLQGETYRVSTTIQNDALVNTDPYRLTVKGTDNAGGLRFQDIWPNPDNRVVRTGAGQFYIDVGPARCELLGAHLAGVSTLSVQFASPRSTAAWPSTGSLQLDFDTLSETVNYTAVSIVSGTGTFTLAAPTTLPHNSGVLIYGTNTLTDSPGELLLDWQVEMTQGGNYSNSLDKIKIITARSASFLPEFKLLIDKSRKLTNSADDCFLGYSEGQLFAYLEGGLGTINAYQPSLAFTFDNFPLDYKQVLLDAGLITGVMSQQLYAIDTDIPNYNDQGTSFVIVHQPQLASFLNQVSQRLDRIIPMMKLQFISPGSLHIQAGPNFRLNQLIQAAPSGSLFRNVFFKG